MLAVLEESYAERITLHTMSAVLNRRPAYLGHLFRRETGMTVRQWLTLVRLERAADMIRAGVKIEAIALFVGYHSKKNFYRQFRRRFATTPSAYGRQEMLTAEPRNIVES